jgi:DNA-binding transcriptional MerR regulator
MAEPLASVAFAVSPSREREYSIGDLAREFGVTLRTLRFYEDRGLLSPRREGVSRYYSTRDRARLSVILKGKQLGFTLAEIKDLVSTKEEPDTDTIPLSAGAVDEQISLLERQHAAIEAALAELKTMRRRLTTA